MQSYIEVSPMSIRPSSRKVRRVLSAIALSVPLTLATGCANMSKETSLSMGGALAGAAIGAQHGGLRGAVIGAAIGGFIGNQIGAHLDEEDRKRLVVIEQNVLKSGKSESFVTNKSKATLTVEPGPVNVEVVRIFKVGPTVETLPLTTRAPQTVVAWVDTPLFNRNDEKSATVAMIAEGKNLMIEAFLTNTPDWMAVVDGDTVIGYVPARYLDEKIVKQEKSRLASEKALKDKAAREEGARLARAAKAAKAAKVVAPAKATSPGPLVEPTVAAAPVKPEVSLASMNGDAPRIVQAMGSCRVLKRKVDTGNKGENVMEEVKYCQDPPPKWKTISA